MLNTQTILNPALRKQMRMSDELINRSTELDKRIKMLLQEINKYVQKLHVEISVLKDENERLVDENHSLAFMLDEMNNSRNFSAAHAEEFQNILDKQLSLLAHMQNNQGDA